MRAHNVHILILPVAPWLGLFPFSGDLAVVAVVPVEVLVVLCTAVVVVVLGSRLAFDGRQLGSYVMSSTASAETLSPGGSWPLMTN